MTDINATEDPRRAARPILAFDHAWPPGTHVTVESGRIRATFTYGGEPYGLSLSEGNPHHMLRLNASIWYTFLLLKDGLPIPDDGTVPGPGVQ